MMDNKPFLALTAAFLLAMGIIDWWENRPGSSIGYAVVFVLYLLLLISKLHKR